MNRLERACYTITSQSGVPRNAQIIIDQSSEVAQTLKTTDFVRVSWFTPQTAGGSTDALRRACACVCVCGEQTNRLVNKPDRR